MTEQLQIDIKRGAVFEDYVEEYFRNRGWTIKRPKGYHPSYDFIFTRDRSSVRVEAKHDLMSDITGNFCIEKATLDHTTADVLILGTIHEAYAIPMDTARKLFNDFPKKQTGDLECNYSAIVPKRIFSHFQKLWPALVLKIHVCAVVICMRLMTAHYKGGAGSAAWAHINQSFPRLDCCLLAWRSVSRSKLALHPTRTSRP